MSEENKLSHDTSMTCRTCERVFEVTTKTIEHPGYCSKRCMRIAKSQDEHARRNPAKVLARDIMKEAPLTPEESAALRARMARYVAEQIERAHDVVMGNKGHSWNSTQARVFGIFMNKVVPDLNAKFVQQDIRRTDVTQLSREELERLALGIHEAAQTINHSPNPVHYPKEVDDAELVSDLQESQTTTNEGEHHAVLQPRERAHPIDDLPE